MGLFDTLSNVFTGSSGGGSGSGGWGWVPAAASIGMMIYANEQQRKANRRQQQLQEEAEQANYAQRMADYEAASEEAAMPTIDPAIVAKAIAAAKQGYSKARSIYQPYHEQAMKLTPDVVNTYKTGLSTLDLLNSYLTQPDFLKQTMGFNPIYTINPTVPKR